MTADARVRLVDYLAGELARIGARYVFGVGGANIEDLYDAVHHQPGLAGVVAKHEFSAATMADGYARATRRTGVVVATSGGGAMNLVPGLAEAHASRVPVLALVGQPPTGLDGRGAFQDSSGKGGSFDAARVFAPVSRFCARVTEPESFAGLLAEAIQATRTHPRGPAVLLLPKDVQQALVTVPRSTPVPPPVVRADPAALDEAVRLLDGARRVLLIAGEGVAASGARAELAELATALGAWVAVSPDAKDVFPNHDPRYVGVAGVMGHLGVQDRLRRADACLLVGTRLPLMARGGLDEALRTTPVVCVDPEPPFVPGIALRGDPRQTLATLNARLTPRPRPHPEPAGDPRPLAVPPPPGAGLSYAEALSEIASALPERAHVFVDAGNVGASAIHLLPAPRDGRFVVAVGMGGMGYTFGAGIGAALGTGRRTYVLAGDGAFFMHGMEVHTAVEYAAPVTFVILNNNAHAMCATREQLFQGGARAENVFRPSDIAAGAAAMFPDLDVSRAHRAGDLRLALLRGNGNAGPALVALDFDHREIPPFLPFLAAPDQEPDHTEESTDDRGPLHVG
ncbi:thiamine pyrophosphate-binding protein [Streptomyces silvisoli]|uniref:Thiamine pyrophosphate-binding protein n=1 Tax=Streptomyces silvisoli TaxID=3034235 RepID=A0ABT5ZCX5_9ACTN|nr:thiamine pyrophosphate-binding protein [Streptomyces silvisoli]MDF3287684.1 thiamine pyrophosphate-binding protein [Streptomyces silvisoli]